jgi:hypothetical protein
MMKLATKLAKWGFGAGLFCDAATFFKLPDSTPLEAYIAFALLPFALALGLGLIGLFFGLMIGPLPEKTPTPPQDKP